MPDHKTALNEVMKLLTDGVIGNLNEISAIGHRIVQGGSIFKGSVVVTEKVIEDIESLSTLAPLHNPSAALVIRAVMKELPSVPQVVVFDTAFHQTMPAEAYIYALPEEQRTTYKIRRYGAHGTSHKFVAQKAAEIIGEKSKIITCHIGSGASITAVKDGKCIDTSMGMTQKLTPDEVNEMLNKQSGKYGLTGYSDSRDFEAAYNRGEPKVLEAMQVYVYNIVKYIGAYIAALGGVDAIVFTAGVGENSPIVRKLVLERLAYLGIKVDEAKNNERGDFAEITAPDSKVRAFVIPTNEELAIAQDTVNLTNN